MAKTLYNILRDKKFKFSDYFFPCASYIMADGKFFNLQENKDILGAVNEEGKVTHPDLDYYLVDNHIIDEKEDANRILVVTDNAIRINDGSNFATENATISLPNNKLTEEQYKALEDFLYYLIINRNESVVVGNETTDILNNYEFSSADKEGYLPGDIIKEIRSYYNKKLNEVIVKKGSKWQVQSEKGRNLGTYDTEEEAKNRLKQVEYFKHLDEALLTKYGWRLFNGKRSKWVHLLSCYLEDKFGIYCRTIHSYGELYIDDLEGTDQYTFTEDGKVILERYKDGDNVTGEKYKTYTFDTVEEFLNSKEKGFFPAIDLEDLYNYMKTSLKEGIQLIEDLLDKTGFKLLETKAMKWVYLLDCYLRDKTKLDVYKINDNNIVIYDTERYDNNFNYYWEYKFADNDKVIAKKFLKNTYNKPTKALTFPTVEKFLDTPNKDLFPDIDLNDLYEYLNKNLRENLNESLLTEKKRSELISKSKSGAHYRTKGREHENRWTRRTKSRIAATVADYNKIDMNRFWKLNELEFGVKIQGETDNYVVTVLFKNILDRIQREIKWNKNKLEFKCILKALLEAFNSEDVYVQCSCPDFSFGGFNFYSDKQNYNSKPIMGPAMQAPKIRNPLDNLGAACKHINLVIANLSWMMKIASVINNYIWYCKDNMELNYAKYIFPKLYGMDYDKAIQLSLFDTDELETDEETINLSNALGRRRTQFRPRGVEGGNPRHEFPKKDREDPNQIKLFNDEIPDEEEITFEKTEEDETSSDEEES